MAYRILKKVKDGGSALNSLYQFLSTVVDGVTSFKEFATKAEVDTYVEEQLNAGVPKTALEVVAVMNYTVSASIDSEDCGCQGSAAGSGTDDSGTAGGSSDGTGDTPEPTPGDPAGTTE